MALTPQKLKSAASRALADKPRAKLAPQMGKPEDHETPDDEAAEGPHDEDEEIAAQEGAKVAAGKGDPAIMKKVKGYDPDRDGNPPQWVTDESVWERAKAAVQKNWDSYDDGWAVVAHVYKAMGGEFK